MPGADNNLLSLINFTLRTSAVLHPTAALKTPSAHVVF